MKSIPITSETLNVARRVVWFKEPEEALADPVRFLGHVTTYGTLDDLKALTGIVERAELLETLQNAPPGVFDARSWAYWNLVCARGMGIPMPIRQGVQKVMPTQDAPAESL